MTATKFYQNSKHFELPWSILNWSITLKFNLLQFEWIGKISIETKLIFLAGWNHVGVCFEVVLFVCLFLVERLNFSFWNKPQLTSWRTSQFFLKLLLLFHFAVCLYFVRPWIVTFPITSVLFAGFWYVTYILYEHSVAGATWIFFYSIPFDHYDKTGSKLTLQCRQALQAYPFLNCTNHFQWSYTERKRKALKWWLQGLLTCRHGYFFAQIKGFLFT